VVSAALEKQTNMAQPQVVIAGGDFGGFAAARALMHIGWGDG